MRGSSERASKRAGSCQRVKGSGHTKERHSQLRRHNSEQWNGSNITRRSRKKTEGKDIEINN